MAACLIAAPIAGAQTPPAASAASHAPDASSWQFEASVYLYLPTIDGSTTFPLNGGSDISVNASDILERLDFAFMGTFDAHKGRWGAFTDLDYIDLGSSKSSTRDFTIGNAGLPAGASANLTLDARTSLWTLVGEYRLTDAPGFSVDALFGARYAGLKQNLDWTISGSLGSIPAADRSGHSEVSADLWDAIIGIRGQAALGASKKWSVPFYLDAGAGDSDHTWQAAAGIAYGFRWGKLGLVWRYLDYGLPGNEIKDLSFNGPVIGATFHW